MSGIVPVNVKVVCVGVFPPDVDVRIDGVLVKHFAASDYWPTCQSYDNYGVTFDWDSRAVKGGSVTVSATGTWPYYPPQLVTSILNVRNNVRAPR